MQRFYSFFHYIYEMMFCVSFFCIFVIVFKGIMMNMRFFYYCFICIFAVISIVSCRNADNADKIPSAEKQKLEQYPDSATIAQARILLVKAQACMLENKTDSVNYYLDKLLTLRVNDLREKYNNELIIHAHDQLIIKHQRTQILLVLVLLAIGLVSFFFYRKFTQNKLLLMNMEEKIIALQKMADSFSQENQTFRNNMLNQFDILRKTASIKKELDQKEVVFLNHGFIYISQNPPTAYCLSY